MCGWYLCHRLFPPLREGFPGGGVYSHWDCDNSTQKCTYPNGASPPAPVNGTYTPLTESQYPPNSYFADANGKVLWDPSFDESKCIGDKNLVTGSANTCIPNYPIWKKDDGDVYFWLGPQRGDVINEGRTRACKVGERPGAAYIGGPGKPGKPDIYYTLWGGGGQIGQFLFNLAESYEAGDDTFYNLKSGRVTGNPPWSQKEWDSHGWGTLQSSMSPKPLFGWAGGASSVWFDMGEYLKTDWLQKEIYLLQQNAPDGTNFLGNYGIGGGRGVLPEQNKGMVGTWYQPQGERGGKCVNPTWQKCPAIVSYAGCNPSKTGCSAGCNGERDCEIRGAQGGCYVDIIPLPQYRGDGGISDLASSENAMRLQVNVVGCPAGAKPPTCATSSLSCQTDYTNAKSATTYDGTQGDFESKCCAARPTCQACGGKKQLIKVGDVCPVAGCGACCGAVLPTCQACGGGQPQQVKVGTPCPNADCTACCGAAPTCATSSNSCQRCWGNTKNSTTYDGTQTDFQSKCCKIEECCRITYDTSKIVGKAGKNTACSPNLQLAAGSSCDVACVAKYKAATGTFTCNADGTITKAALKCIPPNPQCPTNFPCGAGYHLITPLPITPCAASKCGAGDCCAANPFCVSLPQCKKGRQFQSEYKNIQCKSGVCQDAECCEAIPQPTCQGYPCPTHHTIKANADNVTCTGANGCTDDNCCVANAKPTCASDPMLCPPGYENKPNLSNITCREYACTEADCCVTRPPVPHKPNITDITKTRKIDNRKWIDNSRYIKEYDLKDERTQMGIQSGPQYFYEGAEIAPDYDDDFFPPGAFLGFDDNDW